MRASVAAEALRRGGRVAVRVYGTSMLGAIWPGEVVVFERCELRDVRLGEVVLYRRDERLVAHRVAEIFGKEEKLITRGDSLRENDAPVRKEDILGRATVFWRERGRSHAVPIRLSRLQQLFSWTAARSNFAVEVALRIRALYFRIAPVKFIHGDTRETALETSS